MDVDLTLPWAWAEAAYPEEMCGLGVGWPPRWIRVTNVAARPRGAFEFDPVEHLAALRAAQAAGEAVRVVVHSHCDAPPDFSRADVAGALLDGAEVHAGAQQVVLSVCAGRRDAWASYRYDPARGGFVEVGRGRAAPA